MPTPEGLTTTTLHGLYVEPDATGTPLQGSLSFTPNPAFILYPDENVIVVGTETATLDENGEFSIELVSTDNPDSNPSGWVYTVTERIIGQRQRNYNIVLPYTSGVVVELPDITPTEAAPSYLPVVGPQGPPGVVTTVNGYSAAVITLSSADVGAVPLTQKAAANGVATLDATTKIPVAQIPSLSATYVLQSSVGVASGIATLDGSIKVPSAQLNLAASAPPSVGTGAVGASTNLARQDHTHDGVALTGTQSVAGAKNFTTSLQTAQLGVGVAPGTARARILSTVDELGLLVSQVTVTGANPHISTIGFDTGAIGFATQVTGDSVNRIAIKSSGNIELGSGAAARDTTISRSAAGELTVTSQIIASGAAPSAAGHLTRKDYVDGNFDSLTGAQTISGVKTFTAAPFFQAAAAGTVVTNYRVTGDTVPRQTVAADGTISWSNGSSAADTVLFREEASTLTLNGLYRVYRAGATNNAFSSRVTGDTASRFLINVNGSMNWGPGGSTATDTTFYRSAAGVLATDTALNVGGLLTASASLALGTMVKRGVNGTSATLANTTTETVVATLSIPANEAVVGATYMIRVYVDISFLASATMTWRIRWGGVAGTQIASVGPTTLSGTAQSDKEACLEAYVQVLTTGASGTVYANLKEERNSTVAGSVGEVQINGSNGPVTVNTTTTNTLVITGQWGAASASNTLIGYAVMERIA